MCGCSSSAPAASGGGSFWSDPIIPAPDDDPTPPVYSALTWGHAFGLLVAFVLGYYLAGR